MISVRRQLVRRLRMGSVPNGVAEAAASEIEQLESINAELLEALRLTQEYALHPAIEGWSWWDAYRRHADAEQVAYWEAWERERQIRIEMEYGQ